MQNELNDFSVYILGCLHANVLHRTQGYRTPQHIADAIYNGFVTPPPLKLDVNGKSPLQK